MSKSFFLTSLTRALVVASCKILRKQRRMILFCRKNWVWKNSGKKLPSNNPSCWMFFLIHDARFVMATHQTNVCSLPKIAPYVENPS